jgi:hypothetical protein
VTALAARLLLSVLTLLPVTGSAQSDIEQLRNVYLDAVQREAAIAPGLALIAGFRTAGEARQIIPETVLTAYEGAFITLRAKHGFWPVSRLRHLRDGLALMDAAVLEDPDQPEIRYLRLMSCFYLPGILGRGWSVGEDFAALARLLPDRRADYPPALYETIVRFVIEHGKLAEHDEDRLRAALDPPGT